MMCPIICDQEDTYTLQYFLKETCLLFIQPHHDAHQDHDHPDAAHVGCAGGAGVDICSH